MPSDPCDLHFTILSAFTDMILYDSGPGDDRVILMGCAELLDGLARADLWLYGQHFQGCADCVLPALFHSL